ncbi:hypothetical protein BJ973_006707 [Actinoplanes tereljensis]|uniref:Uncharacterized protein n=1 Tax=Paractinoplanes tereljensis TaxID=571912 RepID=A0A919NK58_9ACTN|nr:hypothetical protein [Actinoplanes tereljensis]GIF19663.1 hypothetical protein Ate02nite_23930 [Actinoplanes tereljensis]
MAEDYSPSVAGSSMAADQLAMVGGMTTPSPYEGLNDKQVTTLRFMEQMTGMRVVPGPPPSGSPVARLVELTDALQAGRITPEACHEGIKAIMIEGLTPAELAELNL